MRKLALNDEILLTIEKPARYIGNEVNAVMKDKSEVAVRFAMCFPDVYEIGMSHLGIQILYDMFNQRDDIWCERVYSRHHVEGGGFSRAVRPLQAYDLAMAHRQADLVPTKEAKTVK